MPSARALIDDMRAWADDQEGGIHVIYGVVSPVNGPVAFSKEDIDGKDDAAMLGMLHDRLVKPQPRN